MNQNHRFPLSDCAGFASLLPLVSQNLLSEEKATALHAHLATCAACRTERATYEQAEAALRRVFRQRQEAMSFSLEQHLDGLTRRGLGRGCYETAYTLCCLPAIRRPWYPPYFPLTNSLISSIIYSDR